MAETAIYGLMAEFKTPQELVDAAEKTHHAGYRKVDAYSPYPIEEVWEALGHHHNIVPLMVLVAGVCGLCLGLGLQYWVSVLDYPLNIGGRPFFSWPMFIPISFECTILVAALTAVFGMLGMNGFPQPYHPVFNVEQFARASKDRFFLCIEATDPLFDRGTTGEFLRKMAPESVAEVRP